MHSLAGDSKYQHPAEWDIWLQLPRPRRVRMQKKQRFWITLISMAAIMIVALLVGALFAEWQTHPAKGMMGTDILSAAPFIAGGLLLPLILHFFLKHDRRLLGQGELTIGEVVGVHARRGYIGLGRGGRTVTYEFLDCSGHLVTASCSDNTRSFSEGMAVPVFFNSESPERNQIALCGTPYEIAVERQSAVAAPLRQ